MNPNRNISSAAIAESLEAADAEGQDGHLLDSLPGDLKDLEVIVLCLEGGDAHRAGVSANHRSGDWGLYVNSDGYGLVTVEGESGWSNVHIPRLKAELATMPGRIKVPRFIYEMLGEHEVAD